MAATSHGYRACCCIAFTFTDEQALRVAKSSGGEKTLKLELTSGASLMGGALQIDCPNQNKARARSSAFADDYDVGKSDFTIIARVLTRSNSSWQAFVSKRTSGDDAEGYALYAHRGKVVFQIGRNVTVTSKANISDFKWHTVAAMRDATNRQLRLYVDGNMDDKADDPSGSINNAAPFEVGGWSGQKKLGFCGFLRDVGVLRRTLSNSEVRDIHKDRDDTAAMRRIYSEVLLKEAAEAAKNAEKGLDRAKAVQEAEAVRGEAVHKAKEAQKALISAQKAFKDAEALYRKERDAADKTLRDVAEARTPMAQDVAFDRFMIEKQKVLLVESDFTTVGEQHTKADRKLIEMQLNQQKAKQDMVQKTTDDENNKAMLLTRAEEGEKKAESVNCRTTPASVKMSSRWPMEGTPRDVLANVHATAEGGAVTFDKGTCVSWCAVWHILSDSSTRLRDYRWCPLEEQPVPQDRTDRPRRGQQDPRGFHQAEQQSRTEDGWRDQHSDPHGKAMGRDRVRSGQPPLGCHQQRGSDHP